MQILRHYWESIQTNYWFLPALMTVAAMLLALSVVQLDAAIGEKWLEAKLGWVYSGSAEGARQLLSTVAGSMITVAGVVFSVTIVALSLASSQFGPRLLQNFMRDRGNQIVLGTFIATYVYCLLVLRTVRGEDGAEFVPHIAVTLGVVLALSSVGVLIYFIHHAAVSMQAPIIIANVGSELRQAIDELFPEELAPSSSGDETAVPPKLTARFAADTALVLAVDDGYLQDIDEQRLMRTAQKFDLVARLACRSGQFATVGMPLLELAPADVREDVRTELREAFLLGPQQTPTQDVEFSVRQLVEVAVRALSPGINDPSTAVSCIDFLGAALSRLSTRKLPAPVMSDKEGTARLVRYPFAFANVSDTSIRQIRQYGCSSAAVLIRLLEMIGVVLSHARRRGDRAALLRQALFIKDAAVSLPQAADRADVDERYAALVAAHLLGEEPTT